MMNTCTCGKPVFILKTGECQTCYHRRYAQQHPRDRRTGSREQGPMTYDEMLRTPCSYAAAHYRVSSRRGPASDHTCIDCGEQATEWSYRGGSMYELTGIHRKGHKSMRTTWSTDINDYDPMCQACHARRDGHPYRVGEAFNPDLKHARQRVRDAQRRSERRQPTW